MIGLKRFITRYGAVFALPLWAGILVWPFTGFTRALPVVAAAGVGAVLWKAGAIGALSSFFRRLEGRSALLRRAAAGFTQALRHPAALAGLGALLLLAPFVLNDYYLDILTLTGMYAVLALGLNLMVGQAGLLNLGYAAFYAVGAYTYAILSVRFGLPFWWGLLIGAAAATAISTLIGLSTLNLRGDYFAIVTLGFGEITRIVLNNWDGLTGGPNGIARIGRPVLFGAVLSGPRDFYYLILAIAVITVFAMRRLMDSRIGRAWIAIREDEIAAEAMGIGVFRLKLLAFVIGSAWAGVVGVFFAAKMAFVSPESFTFFESVLILCMVVLGGMGSVPGIILGAFLLIALPELFRDFQDYRMLGFGVALVLMMIFRPQGLLGAARSS